jgi:excisionase family DNA binding protein
MLLTVPEIAAELRATRAYAYKLVRSGRLPSVTIGDGPGRGRMLRVRREDLDAFLDQRRTEAA